MKQPQLVDRFGRPVQRAVLTEEVAAATVGGIRSPVTGYPADGLNPERLATILREADAGDALRFFELAEFIEERDAHYVGILGTRRRSVAQLEPTVEAASDSAADAERADRVRDFLKRDELQGEFFDILDCIGKGISFTEIVWDNSEGQWQPERLERRDQRWFRFDRRDLTTPLMLNATGQEEPLKPWKFIVASIKAKSGLPVRSGIARVAAWNYLFKAFTLRAWMIFTQTYGHPVRVGKYGAGATEADKATLFRAVANIGGDMAAIIPESMVIDFIEARSTGATSDLFLRKCDWLDQQLSKAVLGQTATTDAVTGGLGSGKEHRQVQEDIERADAVALAEVINRDLIRPWMDLEFGAGGPYPRLVLARPEPEDVEALARTAEAAARMGLRVSKSAVMKRLGLDEAKSDDDVLTLAAPASGGETGAEGSPDGSGTDPRRPDREIKRQRGVFKRGQALLRGSVALQAEGAPAALPRAVSAEDLLADRLAVEADPGMAALIGRIEAMVGAAGSLAELREMLLAGFPALDAGPLAEALALGLLGADLAGRVEVLAEDDAEDGG